MRASPVLLALLVVATGCQAIAGIGDVQLSADASPHDADPGGDADAVVDADATTDVDDGPLSDADAGGDADGGSDAPLDRCKSTRGPKMVEVAAPSGASFCIDETEVTIQQFAAFVADGATPTLPARCAGFSKPVPPVLGSDLGAHPRYNVAWCHAAAFCAWAGKRLCKRIDEGAPASPSNSEWAWVCRQGELSTIYPHGNVYDASKCTVEKYGADKQFAPVRSAAACRGSAPPFNAVYDMSGNVAEWVDDCDDSKTPAQCAARGGYFGEGAEETKCSVRPMVPFDQIASGNGFRCCKDPS